MSGTRAFNLTTQFWLLDFSMCLDQGWRGQPGESRVQGVERPHSLQLQAPNWQQSTTTFSPFRRITVASEISVG